MKKGILLIVILTIVQIARGQQDAQYSQYMFNGIYINPAYAGYKEQTNVHAFYRSQWTGIEGAPKSSNLAIDGIANEGNVGLALQLATDKLGAQGFLTAYGNYAYRLRMNAEGTSRLAFGLGVGVVQRSLDGAKLDPRDAGDNYIPTGMQRDLAPDARVGVYYSDDKFYAGLSADNLISQHILKKDLNGLNLLMPKPHYYFTAGGMMTINYAFQLKPSFLLKDDRGGPTSLDLNLFGLIADRIWLGASYRTSVKLYNKDYLQSDLQKKNSMVFLTEIYATPILRIGYSYDQTLSKLQGYSGGTHEISIGYYFKSRSTRMLTPRYY